MDLIAVQHGRVDDQQGSVLQDIQVIALVLLIHKGLILQQIHHRWHGVVDDLAVFDAVLEEGGINERWAEGQSRIELFARSLCRQILSIGAALIPLGLAIVELWLISVDLGDR